MGKLLARILHASANIMNYFATQVWFYVAQNWKRALRHHQTELHEYENKMTCCHQVSLPLSLPLAA